jgi:hypothetical protein
MIKEAKRMTSGLLVVMVLLAILMASVTLAQAHGNPPYGTTYVGSDKCASCHKPIYDNWSATLYTKLILDPAQDFAVIKADLPTVHRHHRHQAAVQKDGCHVGDSQTKGKQSFYVSGRKSRPLCLPHQTVYST